MRAARRQSKWRWRRSKAPLVVFTFGGARSTCSSLHHVARGHAGDTRSLLANNSPFTQGRALATHARRLLCRQQALRTLVVAGSLAPRPCLSGSSSLALRLVVLSCLILWLVVLGFLILWLLVPGCLTLWLLALGSLILAPRHWLFDSGSSSLALWLVLGSMTL